MNLRLSAKVGPTCNYKWLAFLERRCIHKCNYREFFVLEASLDNFLKYLPSVLSSLDSNVKLMGLVVLIVPLVLIIGMRGVPSPWRAVCSMAALFGVMIFLYLMLAPTVRAVAVENPTLISGSDLEKAANEIRSDPGLLHSDRAAEDKSANSLGAFPVEGMILPQSSNRILTERDLDGLDAAELSIARNEIFARNGRYFQSTQYQEYFSEFSWYEPYTWDPELTEIEKRNVEIILAAEAR